jgi:DsbC/DsbD-like thiol-disulfide interchange protein
LLNLIIQIPEGWHINAHRPHNPDLIGTEVQLQQGTRGWSLGPVTYPEAKRQRLGFSSEPLALYTGQIRLQALLEHTPAPGDRSSRAPLKLQVTLQACNEQVCLPPERVVLWLGSPV